MVSRLVRMLMGKGMMDGDCEEIRNLSSDYVDGELAAETVGKVESHLARCGPCTAFINTLRATVRLLRNIPDRQAPGDFRQRVREGLQEERSS